MTAMWSRREESGNDYLLLTPGPLTTTPAVRRAMAKDLCTWDRDYNDRVTEIRRRLVALATHDDMNYTSVLLQGSGTYIVESALGTLVPRNGALLIIENGVYGRRMAEIARVLGIPAVVLSFGETEIPTPERVARALADHPEVTHAAMVHCETTSGVLNPVAPVAEVVKEEGDRIFILDAMSSFGGVPLDASDLGVDVLLSSSNKCIQGVPGFAFAIVRRNIIEACRGRARSLALDLYAQYRGMEDGGGKWRFTSPTHVVNAFLQALVELDAEGGVTARFRRYSENQRVLAEGMRRLGFTPIVPPEHQSPVITTFRYPRPDFDFAAFYERIKAHGFVLYPGKVAREASFRVGSIGDIRPDDIRELLDAIASTGMQPAH